MSDYISRQVLLAVFPFLKSAWGLSDTQLGSLVSIVALMVGVLSIPISFAADRWGRVKSIAAMACVWSLATIACGLAANYGQMFVARTVVGIGEAHTSRRGRDSDVRVSAEAAFHGDGYFSGRRVVRLGGRRGVGWRGCDAGRMAVGVYRSRLSGFASRLTLSAAGARLRNGESGQREC